MKNTGKARRAQSRMESIVALALFAIASVGAWLLYRDAIVQTTRVMIAKLTGVDSGS